MDTIIRSLFYARKWGPERSDHLPKVTELGVTVLKSEPRSSASGTQGSYSKASVG